MIEMVNGYPCRTCTDVSNARRGLDPENPTRDPVRQEQLDMKAGRVPQPAVTFGERLAGLMGSGDAGRTAPPTAGEPLPGRLFDLTV
jgi:hypothetical protein